MLTSFVGDALGPTVGLDDGCSEDIKQEISCVSKCDVKVTSKIQEIRYSTCTHDLPAWMAIPLVPLLD